MPAFVRSGRFDRKSNEHLQAPSPLTNGFIKQEQKIIDTLLVGREGELKGFANHIHAAGLTSQASVVQVAGECHSAWHLALQLSSCGIVSASFILPCNESAVVFPFSPPHK